MQLLSKTIGSSTTTRRNGGNKPNNIQAIAGNAGRCGVTTNAGNINNPMTTRNNSSSRSRTGNSIQLCH